MNKLRIITYLFEKYIYPVYIHVITGEIFPHDKYWNEIVNYNMIDRYNAKQKAIGGEKMSNKEERMLLSPGWKNLKTGESYTERFEIL